MIMDSYRTNKEIIAQFCFKNMSTHTDWTGTIRDNFTSLLKEGQDLFFVINVDESGWASLNLPTDVVKWLKKAL